MTNMALAKNVIEKLLEAGVKEFCLCAGARNSPFVVLFDENKDLKAYHFVNENSAAFFAIGRMASTRLPVAVITTSGTAVAEMLPAAIEATYSSLPLILVTADRPKYYRGSGAPQSIEQVGIFSYYIEASFDLDRENTHLSLKNLSWRKPLHLNVCFAEPLMDSAVPRVQFPEKIDRQKFPEAIPLDMIEEVQTFVNDHKPLVAVSTLPEKYRDNVCQFLTQLQAPIYVEAISGLRSRPDLKDLMLVSGERMVKKLMSDGVCNAFLRIGGVPTLRFWRDLEDKWPGLPVLSIGYNHYLGLGREAKHFDSLNELVQVEIKEAKPLSKASRDFDHSQRKHLENLFEKYPRSETALIHQLSKKLGSCCVYLGNSLPIREWDLSSDWQIQPERVSGSRGANGIDGQISNFLGWARANKENWCIVGDLTALYDLASLWITEQLDPSKLRILIVNNHGGQIFKKMFQREIFLNTHKLDFSGWAKMWNWSYQQWNEVPQNMPILSDYQIIELNVDNDQTQAFWYEWEKHW